MKESPL